MLSELGKTQKKKFIHGAFIKLPIGFVIAVFLIAAFSKYFNIGLTADEILEICFWLIYPCTLLVICLYVNLKIESEDTD